MTVILTVSARAATLAGYWEFTQAAQVTTSGTVFHGEKLRSGAMSPDLFVNGTAPTYSATLSDGSTTLSGAITTVLGSANRLNVTHGLTTGTSGSVENYSLMFDIFSPSTSIGKYRCLLQTNTGNGNDGDYFINKSEKLGSGDLGYSGAIASSKWKRIVLVASMNNFMKVYVDGTSFYTHTKPVLNSSNTRYALDSAMLLFADNDGENYPVNVGAVAAWSGTLSATEVSALGTAGTTVSTGTNSAPVISQGTSTTLQVAENGTASTTLSASDVDGDAISWSVVSQPTHGSVQLTGSNTSAPVSYTPAAGYTGTDSFVIQATDGTALAQITVYVAVEEKLSDVMMTGYWTFDDASNRNKATVGFDLQTSGTGFTSVTGMTGSDGAMQVSKGSFYKVIHGMAPNGSATAQKVNRYTVMWDVMVPSESSSVFKTLLQTDATNTSDGDLFISGSNQVGTSAGVGGYASSALTTGSWYRVVFTVDNGTARNIYVNGTKVYTGSVVGTLDEARYGLQGEILAFADDDGEDGAICVSNMAVWSGVLSATEISIIGAPGSDPETAVASKPYPNSLWEFNEPTRMEAATIGNRLYRSGTAFTAVAGDGNDDGATQIGVGSHYVVPHGLVASSGSGKINEYSILWDVKYTTSGTAKALLQTDPNNAKGADLVINGDGTIGHANLGGFSTQATSADTWYRILLVVKNGTSRAVYVNGVLWLQGNAGSTDDNYALDPASFLAFADNAGAEGGITVTNMAVWGHTVSYAEAVALATPAATVADGTQEVQADNAPVISEGSSYTINASKNKAAQAVTIHATDADGEALTWSIGQAAGNGTATASYDDSGVCTVNYTPASGYTGLDSFTVQVSDGWLTASIAFSVSVTDPAADPVLTVVSSYGTATPAVGAHAYTRGTKLTNSVADEETDTERHHCIGWKMIGDSPAEGSANTMDMTITRDSTLTWQFRTEYRVETAATTGGTVSVASGWFTAGRPIQITAIADDGYYFKGWTGDTDGCTIGGKQIVVPMDRARSAITAQFAPNENFTVIGLPDTQNYSSQTSPADVFTQQTQWTLDNKDNLNIKYLFQVGDLVNSSTSDSQWLRVTNAVDLLNGKLPYGIVAGNHDLSSGDTHYITRFGPDNGRWIDSSTGQYYDWLKGFSPRGYSSYQILNINGRDYMFLLLDCDSPDSDMAWAVSVLKAHPYTPTMLITHDYLAETGAYGNTGSGTGARGRVNYPSPYISLAPDRNTPTEIWNTVIKPFNQVYMVFCGHNFAQYCLPDTNAAGKTVYQVLADYQTLPNGGNGFLRIMEFRPSKNEIYSTTYSPYLKRYLADSSSASSEITSDNTGMLSLTDVDGGEFSVTTDFDTRFNYNLTVVSSQSSVSPATGTNSIAPGTPVAVSADDNVDGTTRYVCTGWTLSGATVASGTGNSTSFTMSGDTTLTWSWAKQYYLSTSAVGRGLVSVSSGWQNENASITVVAQSDSGYSFIGWSGDVDGCTVSGNQITVPMTRGRGPVTAQFTTSVPTYSVTVASANDGVSPTPATYSYEEGTSVIFTAQDSNDGTTRRLCNGWQTSGAVALSGTGKEATITVSGDFTFTWNWKTQYLLTTAVSGAGTVSAASSQWVDDGSAVSIVATPNSGAAFSGWSGDTGAGSANGSTFTIAQMTRPVTLLTANFSSNLCTLTVVSSGSNTVPAPGSTQLDYGAVVAFSASPVENGRSRKVPTGWTLSTGSSTLSGTTTSGTFTIQENTTLSWTWQSQVVLQLTSGVQGAVLPSDVGGWHAVGEQVALEAVPAFDFKLHRWSGEIGFESTSGTVTITMDQPRTIAADFTAEASAGGTPHWWLRRHAHLVGDNFDAAEQSDYDQDGQSAAQEFVAGMDDQDGFQRFAVASTSLASGTTPQMVLTWPGAANRSYSVWLSTNLHGAYSLVSSGIAATEPYTSATVPLSGTSSAQYYRVKSELVPGGEIDSNAPACSHEPETGSLQRTMSLVSAGTFGMGRDNGGDLYSAPAHTVYTSAFFMDQYEVTVADWKKVADWAAKNGYDLSSTLFFSRPDNHPAAAISWYDAVKWCNARSEMEGRIPCYYTDAAATNVYRSGTLNLAPAQVNWTGNGYRLPTEAEWEKACRGGTDGLLYSWGNDGTVATTQANGWSYQTSINNTDNPYPLTTAVGTFSANAYGLYDMHGNEWEWVWDYYTPYESPTVYEPKGPKTGTQRLLRGGSWWNENSAMVDSNRYPFPAVGETVYGMIGFRCVRAAGPNEQ
ncbi:MAG: SUMF1/EgtB/PvdO family nonheme iron enzyme [Chthoniobacteraceae bacterium]